MLCALESCFLFVVAVNDRRTRGEIIARSRTTTKVLILFALPFAPTPFFSRSELYFFLFWRSTTAAEVIYC